MRCTRRMPSWIEMKNVFAKKVSDSLHGRFWCPDSRGEKISSWVNWVNEIELSRSPASWLRAEKILSGANWVNPVRGALGLNAESA